MYMCVCMLCVFLHLCIYVCMYIALLTPTERAVGVFCRREKFTVFFFWQKKLLVFGGRSAKRVFLNEEENFNYKALKGKTSYLISYIYIYIYIQLYI